MADAVKRSVIAILLIVASVLLGYTVDVALDKREKANYPTKYSEYVEKYSEMYGVPSDVVYAVIKTESDFNPDAKSDKGAFGLMQLMPATFEWACGKTGIPYNKDKITDPEMNIQCGVYYLSYCYDQFLIWDTVYAAYNAGHSQVRKWLSDETLSKNGRLTDIPFAETKAYVSRVSQAREKYIKLMEVDTNE